MAFRRRRRINQQTKKSSNASQMMNLSLFIMLLAFFIVLNSLSSYEEIKSEKVRRSIQVTFSKEQAEELGSVSENTIESFQEGHTFDRLDALFQAQIVTFKAQTSKSTGRMNVQAPYDKFIAAIRASNQYDATRYPTRREARDNFFLPTLASLMRANIDGAPTRLDITIHVDGNPAEMQNQSPEALKEKIDILGEVARILNNQKLPEKLINISIEQGDPKMVDLFFQKYAPFSPVREGDQVDGE